MYQRYSNTGVSDCLIVCKKEFEKAKKISKDKNCEAMKVMMENAIFFFWDHSVSKLQRGSYVYLAHSYFCNVHLRNSMQILVLIRSATWDARQQGYRIVFPFFIMVSSALHIKAFFSRT